MKAGLGVAMLLATGCIGSSSSSSDGGGSSGAMSSSGSTQTSGTGSGSSASSGSTQQAPDASAGGMTVAITPDPNGYVDPSTNAVGIQGAWYAYGDGWGPSGMPPGDCESKGMHTTTECSSITFPPAATAGADGGTVATFPQSTAGTMCLSGTAAKVLASDYSNMFGIGIGLDLNNQGGVKKPYAAKTNKITAFQFHITGVPSAGIRVELPIPATDPSGDSWAKAITADGDYTIPLSTTGTGALKASFMMTAAQPPFDPDMIESIQFHIPTNTMAAISVPDGSKLCVSNLVAVVSP